MVAIVKIDAALQERRFALDRQLMPPVSVRAPVNGAAVILGAARLGAEP